MECGCFERTAVRPHIGQLGTLPQHLGCGIVERMVVRPRRAGNSSPRRAADIETSTGLLLACPRSAGFGQHLFVDDLQTKPASLLPIHGTTTLYAPRPFGWLLLTAVPSSSVDGTGSGAETTQSTHGADRTLRCSRPARPVMQALWLYSRCVSLFLWFLTTPRLIPGRGCEAQHDTSRHRERTFSRAGAASAAPIPVLLKKKWLCCCQRRNAEPS